MIARDRLELLFDEFVHHRTKRSEVLAVVDKVGMTYVVALLDRLEKKRYRDRDVHIALRYLNGDRIVDIAKANGLSNMRTAQVARLTIGRAMWQERTRWNRWLLREKIDRGRVADPDQN